MRNNQGVSRDEVLKRMLKTPHTDHSTVKKPRPKKAEPTANRGRGKPGKATEGAI